MQKKSFAAFSTALAAVLMISTGSPAYAADAADGSKMTVQQMRQPIPLSLNKVSKVLGQPDVYVYDCNPEDIYEKSHLKGSIHANKADWMNLLPKDKKNSFVILYCINRMCTGSFEAALEAINAGYENVYVMPDGIQGWVSNGYPFEGTSWKPYESKAPVLLQRKD